MNHQNIPRSLKQVKRAYVPKLDALFYFDYDGMELRILGYYLATVLKDYSVVDEFTAGSDIHRTTASRIYHKPLEDVSDDERQRGKTLGFALLYGGGVPTLLRQGVVATYSEGKSSLKRTIQHCPGVQNTCRKIMESYESKRYIRLIDGSTDFTQKVEHKALNTLIQGTGAAIMRQAFIKIYNHYGRADFKSHIINVVHDEFQMDVSRGEIYSVVENTPKLMQNERINQIIPLEVSIEYSLTNWAEKKPWEGTL